MASISAWVDANVVAGKRGQSSKVVGGRQVHFAATYAKLGAADGNGSVLAFALLPSNAVLTSLLMNSDALTGFSSVSAGYYRLDRDGQTFLDTAKSDGTSAKAILFAAADLSAGFAVGSDKNLLTAVAIADLVKKVWELLGFTDPKSKDDSYVLALTCPTAGTAAGNITLKGSYIQA